MRHIISVEQFDNQQLVESFRQADEFKEQLATPSGRRELAGKHVGEKLLSLFYEPSTRTRLSFETAAANLGMIPISTENAREFSSAAKGETIEDTMKVLDLFGYAMIVLRHHETGGALRAASAVVKTPIINGGDGKGEHPTQAMLDAYTIYRHFGRLSNLHVTIGGDLANGRTARSLAKMLARFPDNYISFISIPELRIGEDIKEKLVESGTGFDESSDMYPALREANVVYWTRTQRERQDRPPERLTYDIVAREEITAQSDTQPRTRVTLESVSAPTTPTTTIHPEAQLRIDPLALEVLRPDAIILHPLPRVGEISTSVDSDPRALYFEQAGNGVPLRMALIDQLIQNS